MIQPASLALERAIVHEAIADVHVENLIERTMERVGAGRRRELLRADGGEGQAETDRGDECWATHRHRLHVRDEKVMEPAGELSRPLDVG